MLRASGREPCREGETTAGTLRAIAEEPTAAVGDVCGARHAASPDAGGDELHGVRGREVGQEAAVPVGRHRIAATRRTQRRGDFVADLVGPTRDARADRCGATLGIGTETTGRLDRREGDTRRGAAPPRVGDDEDVGTPIGDDDRDAVGDEDAHRHAGIRRREDVCRARWTAALDVRDVGTVLLSCDHEGIDVDAQRPGDTAAVLGHTARVVTHVVAEVERVVGRRADAALSRRDDDVDAFEAGRVERQDLEAPPVRERPAHRQDRSRTIGEGYGPRARRTACRSLGRPRAKPDVARSSQCPLVRSSRLTSTGYARCRMQLPESSLPGPEEASVIKGSIAGIVCAGVLALTMPVAGAAGAPHVANANFVGQWTPTPGVAWTILTQGAGGACTGTSADSALAMTRCQVTGDAYTFTLEEADIKYTSNNSGTITGNDITGSFTDSNGTTEDYTATRTATATTTEPTCAPEASPVGTFQCVVTVSAQSSAFGAPTGDVSLAVATGGLSAPNCALVSVSATASSCTVDLTPTVAGNEQREDVRATFADNGSFLGSSGASLIAAVTVTTTATPVATYLEGTSDAVFKITLSRASDHDTVLHYATQDGTGSDAAKAAVGDYQRTDGVLSIDPGLTTSKVDVKCHADVHLRTASDFDLVVTPVSGAELASSVATRPAFAAHADPSGKLPETIDPHLRVGEVGVIRNLTSGGAGKLYVRRFGSSKVIALHEGDALFVGDELFTDPNSAAAALFVLGGAAAVQPGGHVTIVDERHTYTESTGNLVYLKQLIRLISNVSHQKETIQIQTNGGIIGVEG